MIFGTDDRILVDSSNEDGRFVQIKSTFSNGVTLIGSGVMVGANDVLTAAHTFYSHENGGLATSVLITPSVFSDYKPFGSTYVDHFSLTQEWTDSISYQYDYGVLSLSNPIGYYTGWASYGYLNDFTTSGSLEMTSYGYASDIKDANWLIQTKGYADKLQGTNILLFEDDLDASGGQSGSPVMTSSQTQSDVVIGLVSYESSFPDYNGVIALTKEAVTNIDTWVANNDTSLVAPKSTQYSFENVEKISLLYNALLGRDADENGLKYWAEELTSKSFYEIIGGFLDSQELQSGIDYIGDNASFVNSLYTNILNREADNAGLNYWLDELNGSSSKEKLISGFLESVEYQSANSLTTYTIWHNWFDSFQREVLGTSDAEIIKTTQGDDYIDASSGDDIIYGLQGNDYIYSGEGSDTITGGSGTDFFVFDLTQIGVDTVTDFDILNDRVKLLSSSQNLSLANLNGTNDLVLYEDEDSFIVFTGLTKDDYSNIVFV